MFEARVASATFAVTNTNDGEINTIAGIGGVGGFSGDGGAATSAQLSLPSAVAVAADGTVYVADMTNLRVRKISGGIITTLVGNGVFGISGDGGIGTSASVSLINSIALDAAGNNLYILDVDACLVRRVDVNPLSATNGYVFAFAGTTCGFPDGAGGAATDANLGFPQAVAVAPDGQVYISDTFFCSIRRVDTSNIIHGFAGADCASSGDGGPAIDAGFSAQRMAFDAAGNLFLIDTGSNSVRRIDAATTVITTVAGGGASAPPSGSPTDVNIGVPTDIAIDGNDLFVSNQVQVFRLDLDDNVIAIFAGTGTSGDSGDGGPAIDAAFVDISGIARRGADLIIADATVNRIRAVTSTSTPEPTPTPIVNTIAGSGAQGFSGDGGAPLAAALFTPYGIAVAPDGTIYFADSGNFRIRKIAGGVITTVAGTGSEGNDGDGGPAPSASFTTILAIALDPSTDSLYISDVFANRIRRIDLAAGTIHHFAGTGDPEFSGDGPATSAGVAFPEGIAVGPDGSLFIADTLNCRIRRVTAGIMTTIAGTNVCNSLGDGGPATSASLRFPRRVHVGANGDVFIGDGSLSNTDDTVRRIDVSTGLIDKVAGGGATAPGSGTATDMKIGSVSDITLDALGNLYIGSITRVYRVDLATGLLSPYAGTGVEGFSGDGGPAIDAMFYGINALAFQGEALIISDGGNNRLRAVNSTPTPTPTPCGIVTGDLILVGTADTVIDLSCVTAVTGNLIVSDNPSATVIDLSSITTVGGNLIISNNTAAGELDLGTLGTVSGNLEIVNNPAAGNLDLGTLGTVSGNLDITNSQGSGDLVLASLTSVGGTVTVSGNTAAGVLDLGSLTEANSVDVSGNTAAGVLDLGSLETVSGDLTVNDNGDATVNLASLAGVAGDLTLDMTGSGLLDLSGTNVSGDLDLDAAGYGGVSGNTAAGSTTVSSSSGEAVMTTQLPLGAFSAPSSFTITRLDPAALPPEPGTGPEGAALIDPIAAYQFTFNVPTLNQNASLTFDIILDGLDASTRTALLEALASGQATLATKGDAAESTYQAFPICSGSEGPTPDGCVVVETLDANGQPTPGTPAVIRFSNVVGHFSTWAVVLLVVTDTTPPIITPVVSGPAGANGWYVGDVSFSWDITDDESPVTATTGCESASVTSDTTGTTVTCTATSAGGTASESLTIKLDKTPPVVACGAPDGVWHNADVAIGCTADGSLSGLADLADAAFALMTSVPAATENSDAATNARTVYDNAGNSTIAGPIAGNRVDKKAPDIVITSPAVTTYLLTQAVASTYACADGGSGLASCAGPVASGANFDTSVPGANSFTVNASDNVSNVSQTTVAYQVQYQPAGTMCLGAPGHQILAPIKADGSSVFRQNSTSPARFRVCDAHGVSIGTPGVVSSFQLIAVIGGTATTEVNDDVVSATPDAAFRWDAVEEQWVFNISNGSLQANATYVFRITLNDGTYIEFRYGLR